jgi:CheY-like chemotaxis protein
MSPSGKSALSSSSFDWSASRLGEPAAWPQALRLAADLLFNMPSPMLLVWGRDMTVLFNAAYAELAGPAHGRLPGGSVPPVMPPPLAAAAEELARAWQGEATLATGRRLGFGGGDHGGASHDLYFTPVRGATGAVDGVLCALGAAETPLMMAQDAGAGGPLNILVVEDNLDSQYLVCEMLRAFGHEADGVGHPNDALERLAASRYDVLFTDVSLPGMSGVDLARRAVADAPGMRVIFASGYGDTLLRHVEFPYLSLQKPYELDQLQQALDQVAAALPGRA